MNCPMCGTEVPKSKSEMKRFEHTLQHDLEKEKFRGARLAEAVNIAIREASWPLVKSILSHAIGKYGTYEKRDINYDRT